MKDITSFRYRIRARILQTLRMLQLGYIFNILMFISRHRRIPNFQRTSYINDLIFEIKTRRANDILRAFTTDKEFSKIFVRGVLGRDVCVPTLKILRTESEIDEYSFPIPCVVKPTHMSQAVIILRGPPGTDEFRRIKSWLNLNYSYMNLEENYRYLVPKIIVEPLIDFGSGVPDDYKFYIYEGKVHIIEVIHDRFGNKSFAYYTRKWEKVPIRVKGEIKTDYKLERPKKLIELIEISESIGRYFDFVRVDFYSDLKDQYFIGELSHIVADAREIFLPVESETYFIEGVPESEREL